jgi:hypothetical protein
LKKTTSAGLTSVLEGWRIAFGAGAQILVSCQAHKEPVSCINCGRILYYTRDMALAAAE